MALQKDLREFIELLNSNGVEYVIVGGYAVAYHGHPRTTGDIDFFVRCSTENALRVQRALDDFGFAGTGVTASDFTVPGHVVQLGRQPYRIDLLTSISGVEFADAWKNRVMDELDGVPVAFIGRDELLANKRASGRPRDLADLDELRKR